MKNDGLTESEMREGLKEQFQIEGAMASMILGLDTPKVQQEPQKKTVFDILKNNPEKEKGYTAEGYEIRPGESEAVHIEVEQRQWINGKKISKPHILKIDVVDWRHWFQRRGGQGFDINKVLHRPANIAPIQIDDWDERMDENGRMVGINKGETF